ncbi:MAG: DUF418 domain-containing protein [Actinomycetales bacterium]|nr:MAG: DUF418 domain-containing protein [Actinomycetales bacterium]
MPASAGIGDDRVMTTSSPGPLALRERALGPDLTRGVMLLLIALANSHYFLVGEPRRGGFPLDGSTSDAVLRWVVPTFVDGRAYPLFGLLFGYGVAQVVRRSSPRPPSVVRRILWRRALVLVVVGLVHGLLLYVGDILAAYGVLLFLGAWAVRWRDGWLLTIGVVMTVMVGLPSEGTLAVSTDGPTPAELPRDLATMLAARPPTQVYVALLGPIGFVGPFALGLWAGRRRVLERPAEHRRLLRVVAVGGLAAAVVGAQPVALVLSRLRATPSADTLGVIGPLHDATGVLGGLGYAAALALVADRLERSGRSDGRVVQALVAVGRRSMTCYVLQSVVWTLAFTPFLLDLSGRLSVTSTAVLALLTWLGTVLVADRMARRDARGPLESLVRRVGYGGVR